MLHLLIQDFVAAWPSILLSDLLRYLLASSTLALIIYAARLRLAKRRIQKRRAGVKDIRREIGYSLLTVFIFSLVGFSIYLGARTGVFRVDITNTPTLWMGVLEFSVMVILHDAYFYWMHRTIHHPWLFRAFHRLHHRSRTPTPWAAYAFAPLEAFSEAAFLPLVLLVFPTTGLVVFLFTTHMIVRNVVGHAGVELFPKNWLAWPVLRAFNTTTHHDLHHSEFRWNYGLYFTWWDQLMGTEHPEYRKRFEQTTVQNHPEKPEPRQTGRRHGQGVLIVLLALTIVVASGHAFAEADTHDVEGQWITQNFSAIVEVQPEVADGPLKGTVIWVLDLSRQGVVGTNLFMDMSRDSQGWSGGRIFNPENGRTYKGRVSLSNDNSLLVRGCLGPFCQTQVWRRVEAVLATLPAR
ncbi:MAG: sterol desaturase family protein [Proteobacteria bacterium]|nr:sterol desaturase family protein [Pseudomonadota bacterium]